MHPPSSIRLVALLLTLIVAMGCQQSPSVMPPNSAAHLPTGSSVSPALVAPVAQPPHHESAAPLRVRDTSTQTLEFGTDSTWSGAVELFDTTIPGAKWVWDTAQADNGGTATISKSFTLPQDASNVSGTFDVACDDSCQVFINDTLVAEVVIGNLQHHTIPTGLLQPGQNTVRIEGHNNECPGCTVQQNPGCIVFKASIIYTIPGPSPSPSPTPTPSPTPSTQDPVLELMCPVLLERDLVAQCPITSLSAIGQRVAFRDPRAPGRILGMILKLTQQVLQFCKASNPTCSEAVNRLGPAIDSLTIEEPIGNREFIRVVAFDKGRVGKIKVREFTLRGDETGLSTFLNVPDPHATEVIQAVSDAGKQGVLSAVKFSERSIFFLGLVIVQTPGGTPNERVNAIHFEFQLSALDSLDAYMKDMSAADYFNKYYSEKLMAIAQPII